MKINKRMSKKKIIISALVVLVLLCSAYAFVAVRTGLYPFVGSSNESADVGEQKVSLERSKTEEGAIKAVADDPGLKSKNNQTDTPNTPTATSDGGKLKVNVLLTNVRVANGFVSASGFVTDLVETGGSCNYRFIKDSSVVDKPARTLTNPTSTTCETVRFSTNELPADGAWKVSVSYSSDSARGESEQKEFTK